MNRATWVVIALSLAVVVVVGFTAWLTVGTPY